MLEKIMLRWVYWLRTVPQLRLGEALYSAAYDVMPEWAEAVKCVEEVDPFYNNDNIPRFLLYLEETERIYFTQ